MSAIKAVERHMSRRGPSLRTDNTGFVIKTASRVWTVYTDSHLDDGFVATNHQDIPRLRSAYRTDTSADASLLVQEIVPRQLEQSLWELTVQYRTDPPGSLAASSPSGQLPDNPLDWPVKRSWAGEPFDEFPVKDLDGSLVVNSAGQPFDPGIVVPQSLALWTWVRNEPFYQHAVATKFQNKVNSQPFLGQPTNSVVMRPWEASENWHNGIFYVQVTYRMEAGHFEYAKPGLSVAQGIAAGLSPADAQAKATPPTQPKGNAHITELIDQGSYEEYFDPFKDPGDDGADLGGFVKNLPADDDETKFVGPQQLLDATGQFLSRTRIANGEYFSLPFKTRYSIDFNLLGLF